MPTRVEPRSYLLSKPEVDWHEMERYFEETGYGREWLDRWLETPPGEDIEALDEFAARRCYRSFEPGLNPNITQVRTDSEVYFDNIKTQRHGSVFEHGMFTFGIENVSRVFTHELVRHRVGVGISQESMRYVRLTDLPFWFPDWALDDDVLMERCWGVLEVLENHQKFMTVHFGIEKDERDVLLQSPLYQDRGRNFGYKKFITSFMRRFAPEGVATGIVWSANPRIARHVISMRTAESAEEEIRFVFRKIAAILIDKFPLLFGDFEENNRGEFTTPHWKV